MSISGTSAIPSSGSDGSKSPPDSSHCCKVVVIKVMGWERTMAEGNYTDCRLEQCSGEQELLCMLKSAWIQMSCPVKVHKDDPIFHETWHPEPEHREIEGSFMDLLSFLPGHRLQPGSSWQQPQWRGPPRWWSSRSGVGRGQGRRAAPQTAARSGTAGSESHLTMCLTSKDNLIFVVVGRSNFS